MKTDDPHARRRAALMAALGDRPALVAAGLPQARNYPANLLPYRASSHFLYLVGRPLPGAWLLLEGGAARLYVEPPPPDDALWHGPTPSPAALGEALGLPVAPLAALAPPPGTMTLPAMDAATRARQAELLGRAPAAGLDPRDHPLADAIIALRLRHDAAAITELRAAAEATVAAHRAGRAAIEPGRREWAVWAAMQRELTRRGLEPAYPPIVTRRGEVLHERGLDRVLERGDLLLADVGAESRGGFAADVTRTWPVGGPPSSTQAELHAVVRAAQSAAIDAVAPGVRFRDVHLVAARALTAGLVDLGILRGDVEQLVADDVHALFFPHGVGHLLGLDVHDMEDLGDRAGYAPGWTRSTRFGLGYLRLDRVLEPGMAVTIEPGFYQVPALLADPARDPGDRLDRAALARFADVRGIRIEDDVLVTATGHEVLTGELERV